MLLGRMESKGLNLLQPCKVFPDVRCADRLVLREVVSSAGEECKWVGGLTTNAKQILNNSLASVGHSTWNAAHSIIHACYQTFKHSVSNKEAKNRAN